MKQLSDKKTYNVLGVGILDADRGELLEIIEDSIMAGQKLQICTLNNEFLVEATKNARFKDILNTSLCIADSTGVVWAIRKIHSKTIERIPGADLAYNICELCLKKEFRLLLLGGGPGVGALAKDRLQNRYKGLHIVGAIDSVRVDENKLDPELISQINRARPDVIFVALGAPKQELWIAHHKDKLNAKIFIGVGGTLDFISGKIKRAPKFMRDFGFEWLYRLILQPSRIGRIFRAVIVFPLKVFFTNSR